MAKDVFQQAMEMYPILKDLDIQYLITPEENRGYLEFYPPDEPGSEEYPRPKELPMGKLGVQVFDERTRPIDVLGDVTSHWLIYNDPVYKKYYEDFVDSLTPEQKLTLGNQYRHYRMTAGEDRPYEQWQEISGLPGYFRGYAFDQWDKKAANKMYTPEQLQMFDRMMNELTNTVPSSRATIIE